jgi:hypothetical protein
MPKAFQSAAEDPATEDKGPTLETLTSQTDKAVYNHRDTSQMGKIIACVIFVVAISLVGATVLWCYTSRVRSALTLDAEIPEDKKFFLLQPSSGRTIGSSTWNVRHAPGGITVRSLDQQRSTADAHAFWWKEDINNIGFAEDPRFACGVCDEKYQEGNNVILCHNPANGFATDFIRNPDSTLSIKDKPELVLGFGPCFVNNMGNQMGESRVILVKRKDEQRLVWVPWEQRKAKELEEPQAEDAGKDLKMKSSKDDKDPLSTSATTSCFSCVSTSASSIKN